jgi:hypothetical protein
VGCSTYKNDYVELFNAGMTAVDLSTYSIQYQAAGTTGAFGTRHNLTGMIQPGAYYLVAESFNDNGTNTLPTADATGTINMSATAGKVALASIQTAISGCTDAAVIDLVGYGSGVSCSETAASPAPSTTLAVFRAGGGCTDTNNNSMDFTTGAPSPRNSASATTDCGAAATGACCAAIGDCSVTTSALCAGSYQGNGTVCDPNPCVPTVGACCSVAGNCTLTTAAGCTGSSAFYGVGISCEAASPPCVTQLGACCNNNDGSCFTTVAASCGTGNTYSGAGTTCTPNTCTQPSGACCTGNQAGATCSITTADLCAGGVGNFLGAASTCTPGICVPPQVVISQLYGGGGATTGTPTYMQDFAELFNRSGATVDISGWSVQYASAAGTSWDRCTPIPAGTTIAPGGYFLIKFNQSGTPLGADLTGEDFTPASSLAMSATNGKVALVRSGSFLSGACPAAMTLVADFIGYGTADCFEGAAAVGTLSNTTSAQRLMNGCQDTDQNGADFAINLPGPRNSTTPAANCGGPATGACCSGSTCTVLTAAACTGANTSYKGDGTVCNAPGNLTSPCCKADFNQSGSITVQDIFDFLAAYFTVNPQADINGVGGITVQDIFDYLAAYFAGCA